MTIKAERAYVETITQMVSPPEGVGHPPVEQVLTCKRWDGRLADEPDVEASVGNFALGHLDNTPESNFEEMVGFLLDAYERKHGNRPAVDELEWVDVEPWITWS